MEIENRYTLDIADFVAKMDRVSSTLGHVDELINRQAKKNPLAEVAAKQTQFNQQLGQQAQLYQRVGSAVSTYRQQQQQVAQATADVKKRQDELVAANHYGRLKAQIAQAEAQVDEFNQRLADSKEKSSGLNEAFSRMGTAIKTAFTVTGILFLIEKVVELGQKIIEVTGTGERYQNQFTRIFEGNAEASKGYLATLQQTADTTNFTFDELADNVAKLASRGIIPTQQELLKLGDTANFINKPFEQLNEAILDANNPERWKELGFTVTTEGDKMTLSYGNFSKTVDKTVKGAYEAIQAFSQQEKVLGSTAEAGKTLSGRMSTLADNFAGIFRTIGEGNKGPLNDFLDFLSRILLGAKEVIKQLQPAFEGVGKALLGIGNAIGSVLTTFTNFTDGATSSATAAQKFGFYLNKYILTPLTFFTTVTTSAVEGLNLMVQYTELAAAKLSGNKGLAATIGAQIDESKARLKDLQKEAQRIFNLPEQKLSDYVKADEQRKRREERRARLAQQAAENFKPTPTDSTAKTKPDPKVIKAQEEEARLLLSAKEEYQKEAQKLEEQFGKDRLELLQKDSEAYINAKAALDQKELKLQRDTIERKLQLAKSEKTVVVNGKRQVVADTSITLANSAPQLAQIFADREQQIEAERARQVQLSRIRQEYQLLELAKKSNETELQLFDKQWEEKLLIEKKNAAQYLAYEQQYRDARKLIENEYSAQDLKAFDEAWKQILSNEEKNAAVYKAMVAKRNRDRNTLVVDQILKQVKDQQEIELAFTDTDRFAQNLSSADPSLNADDIIEKREQAKLAIRIKFGNETIKLLKEQGEAENAVLITQTQAAVDSLKEQQEQLKNNTPKFRDIFDLLGLTDGMNQTQLSAFKTGIQQIGDSIKEVTSLIIDQSNQRLQAIDQEIQAKEEQVRIEQERDKEGFANNLAARQAELDDLKRKKAEELQIKRNAVRVQQGIDAATQLSNTAVAVSNGIAFLTGLAKEEIKLGPIAGPIAFFGTLAAMLASIFAATTKLRALAQPVQLRKGGRIGMNGRTHEQGGHRIEGTNIEVERDEWIVNGSSSDRFNETLEAINQNDPYRAIAALIHEGKVGLPPFVIQHMQQPSFGAIRGGDFSTIERHLLSLNDRLSAIEKNTKPGKQRTGLGDGWVLEQDGSKETVRKITRT